MPVERPLSDEELGMAVMLKTSRFSWSFFVESVSAAAPLVTPWGSSVSYRLGGNLRSDGYRSVGNTSRTCAAGPEAWRKPTKQIPFG